MSSTRQPPLGTPQLSTHAGLTPQMSIVDANGRPTMFFFRWLLTIGGAALTASDLDILESFDPGADAALAEGAIADALDRVGIAADSALPESAIADALEAAGLAAGFEDSGAARADLIARIEELALAGALHSVGGFTGPDADQRALEALMMADAPATPATPIAFLADTLANWTLANYNPANYANGQPFLVTSWDVTYTDLTGVWTYTSGVYIAPAASRPATAFNGAPLGPNDAGLRFLASDTGVYQYWNGTAWVPINASAAPITVVNFTPVMQIGGSPAGITITVTQATSTITGSGTGAPVTVFISITVTAWPASPSGTVQIVGLPVVPLRASWPAVFLARSGFVGLTGPITPQVNNVPNIVFNIPGATGVTPMPATAIAAGAVFTVTASYLSA